VKRRGSGYFGVWVLLAGCGAPVPGEPAVMARAQVDSAGVAAPSAAPSAAPVKAPPSLSPVVAAPTTGALPVEAPATDDPATPARPPRPVKPAASWVVPADSTFQLAGFRDGELQVLRLADEVVVAAGRALARVDEHGALRTVEYALSGFDPGGPGEVWSVAALGGRWPDTWMVAEAAYSRSTPRLEVYRREANVWRQQMRSKAIVSPYYSNIVDSIGGPVIGLRANAVNVQAAYEEKLAPRVLRKIAAAQAADPERLELLTTEVTPATQEIADGLTARSIAGADTGELFMLATRAADEPVVQRWGTSGAAAKTGTVDALPGVTACSHLGVRAADEAYLRCSAARPEARPVVLRFDGIAWSPDPPPPRPTLKGLSVAPDGGLWAITDVLETDAEEGEDDVADELWRRPARGAAWEQVALPKVRFADRAHPDWNFSVSSEAFALAPADAAEAEKEWSVLLYAVVARSADDVWVLGATRLQRYDVGSNNVEFRYVVLHSGPAREPEHFLPGGNLYLDVLDWRPAPAWQPGKGCGEEQPAFVVLRTLPRDTLHNLPEPAFEALVQGHAQALDIVDMLVEVVRRGRRTMGLIVRPKDRAGADALLAALAAVAPGEHRTIECRRPRIRRSFSKTTGLPQEAPPP